MTAATATFREKLHATFLAHRSRIARVVGVAGLVVVLTNVLNHRSHPVTFRCDLNDRAALTQQVRFVVSDASGDEFISLERRYEPGAAPRVVTAEGHLRPGIYSVEEVIRTGEAVHTSMKSVEVERNGDYQFGMSADGMARKP